jgi:hypothetical protein
MTKFLLSVGFIALAGLGTAHAQTAARGTFTSPAVRYEQRTEQTQQFEPRTRLRGRVAEVGAIPRAARGNPVQMINPRAPRRYYGHPEETVVADPQNPNRLVGVILFGLRW